MSQLRKASQKQSFAVYFLQYLLPAIVHINHQPYPERGDGPIVSQNLRYAAVSNVIACKSDSYHTLLLLSRVLNLFPLCPHRFWCLHQLESWLSKFNRLHMTTGSVPVSKAPVSMVELLKGLRFETLRGVGTVLGWIQGTFTAFILKSLVFESFEHEIG